MIKVVIDTNVFVSSFFGGNPRKVIDLWKLLHRVNSGSTDWISGCGKALCTQCVGSKEKEYQKTKVFTHR